MELSSILEADIQGIQKQIKTAILNHQIGMMKLRNDPENLDIKKQIADAQNMIISLSTSQKFILQKLRNDVHATVSSKTSCDNGSNNKGVITVNGLTTATHGVINNAHIHMGQNNNQHVSVVRPRTSAVSVGTETVGLAAVARENQPAKTNGNYVPVTPNVACDASSLGGKLAQEGPPYTRRPHPTAPPPIISSHQSSNWQVDGPPRSQINLVPRVNSALNRASLSPSSSGGEDLDDEEEEEEEEEVQKSYEYDEEDDMEELKYVPEEDEKEEESLPKKENQSPCKHISQSHPADDNDVESKLKFFAALGLVTRETCSEMQSRRGERKRRSTANPQFVYGNWDLSKRKKNGYLLSSSLPLQLRKRGRPRLDGSSELYVLPPSYLPLPKSLSSTLYSKDMSAFSGNDHFNENQHQFSLNRGHQMLGHALGGALKPSQHYFAADSNHSFSTGHHPKKPLEHINGNITTIRKFCIVCKNMSGPLVLCEDCDVRYHPFCGKPIDGKRHCPKCETHSSTGGAPMTNIQKEEVSMGIVLCRETAITTTLPASTVTCNAQVTASTPPLHMTGPESAAKVEEKRRLLKRNQDLNAEKAKLEQRVSELTADLSAQAARKKDLLFVEERTRQSIKRVHEFIRSMQQGFKRINEDSMFKTATAAGPCSVATDTSDGMQSS